MRMTTCTDVDEAVERVKNGDSAVMVDFSGMARIDPHSLGALEELADLASSKGAEVTLRAVHGDIYKVLKLLKLAERFVFVD